jgi:hypothetical protein
VRLKTFYLLAAIAGAVVPWLFFAGFFVEYGPDPYHARGPRRHSGWMRPTGPEPRVIGPGTAARQMPV